MKTVNFGSPKYVGDPINAVRIFNEKEVDELIVLDIDATVHGKPPDLDLVGKLAAECRMPLCYGGGVKTVRQADALVSMGVEKVAISSAAIENPALVTEIAESVGSQSVAVVLDVARGRDYELRTHNGTRATGRNPAEFAAQMERLGAGEIVVNAIANDGVMEGYDMELARLVREAVSVPITVLGGAGSLDHIRELISAFGVVGAAAGSLFVFKGVYRAVLINYPGRAEKDAIVVPSSSSALP